MTGEELKNALVSRCPVIYTQLSGNELEYAYVSGIIYRIKNGKIDVSAELMDKNLHSITIVSPLHIEYKEK